MGVSSQYVASSASIADGAVIEAKIGALAVSEAKLKAEACSAAKMKKEGTSGHVLTSNGAGAVPSYQAVAAAAQDCVMIERQTLAASASSISFTGFAAGYKSFRVVYQLKVKNSFDAPRFVLNNDTTADIYKQNYESIANTTHSTNDLSTTYILLSSSNSGNTDEYHGYLDILNEGTTCYRSFFGQSVFMTGASNSNQNRVEGLYKSTSDITRIDIASADADGLAIGTIATLYGFK